MPYAHPGGVSPWFAESFGRVTASAAKVVLGLDIGTTSAKAVAFDPSGATHGAAGCGYPLLEPEHGHAEQEPERVLDAADEVLRGAAAAAREQGAEVAGIAISTAMHALVGVDADGRPLTRVITWADTRAADEAERLRAEHPELHDRTGTPLHPMAPLPKLLWLRAHAPDTFAAVRRWGGLKELLLARLTGEWAVDHSIASGTALLDLQSLSWDAEALELAHVDADQLGRLVPTTEVLRLGADAAGRVGLPEGTPVVAGGADGPLANLGVGAVRPGVAACSIGTSGALRLVVERPAVDPRRRVFCYALVPDRWVVGGAINNGGVVLHWAADALAPDLGGGREAAEALVDLAAHAPAGSDGLLMLPYLLSERAPNWSPLPRGAYIGLTRHHRREHLVRAALEGVCLQLALVLASMRDAGNEVREVRATGGFARSTLWRQILADALGVEIGFPPAHEGSAFGAALLGMQALGLVESIDVAADLVRIEDVVEPNADAAAMYAEALPTFAGLYDALEPAFGALQRLATHEPPEPDSPREDST
jgi:gluconokinase